MVESHWCISDYKSLKRITKLIKKWTNQFLYAYDYASMQKPVHTSGLTLIPIHVYSSIGLYYYLVNGYDACGGERLTYAAAMIGDKENKSENVDKVQIS